ncbi:SctD/MshK family protein [Rhizobium paknamense]|uniref:YscD/Y4YQ C-terminal domain-containing protein n=1 Tax=Rhizobium paknamense TaxID=1206817 RepID=A0ABU0IDS0_9HYPH|nr:hypothetical protein [Rhizobium paknamense]MDQ0456394.1 hypothetical protein [Rhizobium paknamense]
MSEQLLIHRQGRESRFTLEADRLVIGGSADCDIVIIGIASAQTFLMQRADNGQTWNVEALQDGVMLDGHLLKPGEPAAWPIGAALSFQDVECRLPASGFHQKGRGFRKKRHVMAACLLFTAALLLLAGTLSGPDDTPQRQIMPIASSREDLPASAVAAEISQSLRLAHLPDQVTVETAEDRITIGRPDVRLRLEDKARLADIIRTISRRSPLPVVDQTQLTSGLQGFVAAVGYQPMKFIVGTDGKRYREGDLLPGGWRLQAIQDQAIRLAHEASVELVPFGRTQGSADTNVSLRLMPHPEQARLR